MSDVGSSQESNQSVLTKLDVVSSEEGLAKTSRDSSESSSMQSDLYELPSFCKKGHMTIVRV